MFKGGVKRKGIRERLIAAIGVRQPIANGRGTSKKIKMTMPWEPVLKKDPTVK